MNSGAKLVLKLLRKASAFSYINYVGMVSQQKALNIKIYGKVQRVACRSFLFERAVELSIKGHVKNMTDGTVVVFAMGTNLQLDEFLEWCHKGSPTARVKKVEVEVAELSKEIDFRIIRN